MHFTIQNQRESRSLYRFLSTENVVHSTRGSDGMSGSQLCSALSTLSRACAVEGEIIILAYAQRGGSIKRKSKHYVSGNEAQRRLARPRSRDIRFDLIG